MANKRRKKNHNGKESSKEAGTIAPQNNTGSELLREETSPIQEPCWCKRHELQPDDHDSPLCNNCLQPHQELCKRWCKPCKNRTHWTGNCLTLEKKKKGNCLSSAPDSDDEDLWSDIVKSLEPNCAQEIGVDTLMFAKTVFAANDIAHAALNDVSKHLYWINPTPSEALLDCLEGVVHKLILYINRRDCYRRIEVLWGKWEKHMALAVDLNWQINMGRRKVLIKRIRETGWRWSLWGCYLLLSCVGVWFGWIWYLRLVYMRPDY